MLTFCRFPEGAHAGSSVSVPESLRSPQVASDDDDSNVAVHVAGDVIQYGMVRFQLDHSHHHGDVQRHLVGSRSGHEGKYASTSICLSGLAIKIVLISKR